MVRKSADNLWCGAPYTPPEYVFIQNYREKHPAASGVILVNKQTHTGCSGKHCPVICSGESVRVYASEHFNMRKH